MKRLCSILGIARSSYCCWSRTAAAWASRRAAVAGLAARIRVVHRESDGTCGVARITAELRDGGERVNCRRIARVMRSIGLADIRLRRRHCTTVADPPRAKAPDLIGCGFTVTEPNTMYVGDFPISRWRTGSCTTWRPSSTLLRAAWSARRSPLTCAPSSSQTLWPPPSGAEAASPEPSYTPVAAPMVDSAVRTDVSGHGLRALAITCPKVMTSTRHGGDDPRLRGLAVSAKDIRPRYRPAPVHPVATGDSRSAAGRWPQAVTTTGPAPGGPANPASAAGSFVINRSCGR
ncbi:IS3 family transposase [Streptomyces sp. NBC_01230]|uniref:IS3 family transposase n=1 Tax=Streptomyces sp. NBC_01230 TaxID=2903784 RepID=UPI003FA375C1